uniref:Lipoprotein NlpD n=1 Tax=Candidatus Kentrum sp. MB TaxID=2138164 RepID=A0A450XMD2_9GAMM|nr:MAG: lipoprotein NlpD [Candidatus Kentron sp. MB]VFK75210.1 MAG: lipoprotein NlpD [Candidatus Kentron sp. MB]
MGCIRYSITNDSRGLFGFVALIRLSFLIGLSACASHGEAPVGRDPYPDINYHTVRKGENVYAIAMRHGLDYHQLAKWNGIEPPFKIYPGDKIRLMARARAPYRSAVERPAVERIAVERIAVERIEVEKTSKGQEKVPASQEVVSREPLPPHQEELPPEQISYAKKPAGKPLGEVPAHKDTRIEKQAAPKASPAPPPKTPPAVSRTAPPAPRKKGDPRWQWPSKGKLLHDFARSGNRGLDIAGSFGSPIYAAAKGKVVYTGSGLRGYGKLIIIKHDRHYLSAYANNDRMLVREGMNVSRGQKIAEMGKSGDHPPLLHFEIRKNGRPVNPMKYLKGS